MLAPPPVAHAQFVECINSEAFKSLISNHIVALFPLVTAETMSNNVDMDDDDIYPENDGYVPQESRMQDMEDEEEGEELESDSDVRISLN